MMSSPMGNCLVRAMTIRVMMTPRMTRRMRMRTTRMRIPVRKIPLKVTMRTAGCPVGGGLTARDLVTRKSMVMSLEQVVDRRDLDAVDLLVLPITI